MHEEADNTLKEKEYSEVSFQSVVILLLYAIKFISFGISFQVFWNMTSLRVANTYNRFGGAYLPYFQNSSSSRILKLEE